MADAILKTGESIKCEPHGLYMCSHCAMKVSDSDLTLLRITFANIAKHTGSPSDAMVESALLELIEARRALTASESLLREIDTSWLSAWPEGPNSPVHAKTAANIHPETAGIWRRIRAILAKGETK